MGNFLGGQKPIRRRNHGIVKVLMLGEPKVGKTTLLQALAREDIQPLATWEARRDSESVTVVVHKEDRAQTYIEKIAGSPFPTMAISACDSIILCFSLVDRRTWGTVKTYYLSNILAEIEKNQGYRPIILVGLKADVRNELLKEEADRKKKSRTAGDAIKQPSPLSCP